MANNTSIPIIVQGNSYTLSIPLQVYYVDDDEMVLRDYTPVVTDKVVVQLKGERRSYTYTPTIDGSTALVELAGTELADRYAVMVSIIKDNGQRLRSYRTDQFFIVESSDDLTPADIIEGLEENVIYLNSSIFVAGEQGEQGEQGVGISSIAKTATSGLVDTYTITLTNGNTYTFTVTNGEDGHDLGLASIINNLNSDSIDDALSAAMGKELKGMIDNIDFTLKSGTYAEALEAVLASNSVFEWLLVDEVDNSDLIKPLWHVNGSLVDAAGAVVSLATLTAPTFSIDSGDVTAGTTLTITCPSGNTLNYSVNGVVATSTSDVTITINEACVVKAYLKSGDAVSDIVAKSYGIAVDHRFQFKIKLTGDNSTEYVPVVFSNSPIYKMTVDWGDGSPQSEYDQYFSAKGCNHTYSGTAGTEFTITLRGSAIPYLAFASSLLCNVTALVAVLDNTLECKTNFSNKEAAGSYGFQGCTNLESLSANALSNSTDGKCAIFKGCTKLTSIPAGIFENMPELETCNNMFYDSVVVFTNDNIAELKTAIKDVTNFGSMFYSFDGTLAIPNDFFDGVNATITSVSALFGSITSSNFSGDAQALYDVLVTKVGSGATTGNCFASTRLTNRNQVPNSWGGTAG